MNNIRFLLLGGAGSSISNSLLMAKFNADQIYYFDTDNTSLSESLITNKFLIGENSVKGISTKGDMSEAIKAYSEDIDLFRNITKQNLLYIIVGCLGGGFCSGVLPKLAELLQSQNAKFIVLVTVPFAFEGLGKQGRAKDTLKQLADYTDKTITIQCDELQKYIGDLNLEDIFRRIDFTIVEILKEIVFEFRRTFEIVRKESIKLSSNLEDVILEIKSFVAKSELIISSTSSKVIVSETNTQILKLLSVNPDFVHRLSPRKFEELVEYIYKLSGAETKLTKQSRDGGADVLVWTPPPVLGNKFLTVVQAKKFAKKNKVGDQHVRDLIGTTQLFKADKGQLVSTSDYSKPAIKAANASKIDLIKFNELNDTIKKYLESPF